MFQTILLYISTNKFNLYFSTWTNKYKNKYIIQEKNGKYKPDLVLLSVIFVKTSWIVHISVDIICFFANLKLETCISSTEMQAPFKQMLVQTDNWDSIPPPPTIHIMGSEGTTDLIICSTSQKYHNAYTMSNFILPPTHNTLR
jgi:hypothetical protein